MNDRKKNVMEAALKLFIEKGFQETSLQDILDSSGISKGTFYNYFTSKNECLRAILEQTRDIAMLTRNELLIGKDSSNVDILIEQITLSLKYYAEQNINSIFNSIQYTNDAELKKMIINHRVSELEWMAERLTDVFGDEVKPYSFECAVIFFGIVKEMFVVWRMVHINRLEAAKVAKSAFEYVRKIIKSIDKEKEVIFNIENVASLKNELQKRVVSKEELIESLSNLKEKMLKVDISNKSIDLTNAIYEEIEKRDLRESIVEILLPPFYKSYKGTKLQNDAQEIAAMIWNYLKHQKLSST